MTVRRTGTLNIPEGFVALPEPQGHIGVVGPLYLRHDKRDAAHPERDGVQLGFRVEPRHCNPASILHGGMMATFADMLLPLSAHRLTRAASGHFLPTISLQLDYLAPVPLDAWVQGEAQVLRATRSMLFMQGLVWADGHLAARVAGILKIGVTFESLGWKPGGAPAE
jgi:uncharacterized protein (TIGR00369 family)